MKGVLLFGTLIFLVIAGACSAVLVATDWDDLTSDDNHLKLGGLMAVMGAGLGAIIALSIASVWTLYRKNKASKPVAVTASDKPKLREIADKPMPDMNPIQIQVHHVQKTPGPPEIKSMRDDAIMLNKLGFNVKHLVHKMKSLKIPGWGNNANGEVFTPPLKSWEKNTMNPDGFAAPTPRIYVLPPDDPEGISVAQWTQPGHSRSRSEVSAGKVGMPDIAILEIKKFSNSTSHKSESDGKQTVGCEISEEVNDEEQPIENPSNALLPSPPQIRVVDTQLSTFIRSLSAHSSNSPVYMLSVMIEEVLPRPDSGLLKRMLRMSEIPIGRVEGSGEPILHLRVGSECHLSVGLIKVHDVMTDFDLSGPHSIKLKPLDGEEVKLNATYEAVDGIEHVTSAFWDLKSHTTSHSLTRASTGDAPSTVLTPIEMIFGFRVHARSAAKESDFIEIEVKKTFMASMRRDLVSIDVDKRFTYEDAVLEFLLTKMELISVPALLTFLEFDP